MIAPQLRIPEWNRYAIFLFLERMASDMELRTVRVAGRILHGVVLLRSGQPRHWGPGKLDAPCPSDGSMPRIGARLCVSVAGACRDIIASGVVIVGRRTLASMHLTSVGGRRV